MFNRHGLIVVLLVLLSTVEAEADPQSGAPRPNIVLMTADNLGYHDTRCYGNDRVITPNIDRLAAQGVRCTNFYSASPTCTVSRAAYLLLGAKSGEAPFVGMLSNGTSGDVNNSNRRKRAESYPRYEKMNEVAERVARRVKEAHDRIEYRDWVLLGSAHRELELKVRKPDAQMRQYFAKILGRPAGTQQYHPAERTYAGRVQRLLEGPDEITIPLQAVRIGDIGIAAIPFEVFAAIGLEIKEKAPFADAFTIELANDCHGYLPSPRQHELGGYETWMGANKVQEDASVIIVGQLLEMFAELAR